MARETVAASNKAKLDFLCSLVDEMAKRGAVKITHGTFSVDLHPNFSNGVLNTETGAREDAREAVKEAFDKVKRLNEEEDIDLLWSAP